MRAVPVLALLAALASGCAERGDFGRPKHSLWNDVIVPTSSYALSSYPGLRSRFTLTDDETELRERAYRFVTPPHDRMGVFSGETIDATRYHWALSGEPRRSPVSRYRRLAEDAQADRNLIRPFRAVAGRVASADEVRLRTAEISPLVNGEARSEARARVDENRAVVEKLREQLRVRHASYRYALDNLVVESPAREAVDAERALNALQDEIALLDVIPVPPLDCGPCGGMPGGSLAGPNFGKSRPEALPPRLAPPPPAAPRPLVLKN